MGFFQPQGAGKSGLLGARSTSTTLYSVLSADNDSVTNGYFVLTVLPLARGVRKH